MAVARPLLRALPSVVVAALVVAAAAAQSGPSNPFRLLMPAKRGAFATAGAGGERGHAPAPAAAAAQTCRSVSPSATITAPVPGARVWQPDAVTITASQLTVTLSDYSGAGATFTAQLAFFDPGSSDMLMSSYPLRVATLTSQGLGQESHKLTLDRRIVVREIGSTVTVTAGLSIQAGPVDMLEVAYEPDGPPQYRPAMFDFGPGAIFPLPGGNPVLGHEVCSDSDGDDGLFVLRQAIQAPEVITVNAQLVQTFTCPVTVTAEWVELAIASPPGQTSPMEVSIFDMQGALEPPGVPLPVTTTASTLDAVQPAAPVWAAASPLTETARLEAGHRYALAIMTSGAWSLGMSSPAPGSPESEIGELFSRAGSGGAFQHETGHVLAFRLIGRPPPAQPPGPPSCDVEALSRAITVTASFPIPPGRVVAQPLAMSGSDLAIGRVSWLDPSTATATTTALRVLLSPPGLPPNPNWIALRDLDNPTTRTCTDCGWGSVDLGMPLVTSAVTVVAHGGGSVPSLTWQPSEMPTPTAAVGYDEASSSGLPPAMYRDAGMSMWQPLPGLNPVVAHVACPATPTAQGPLRAVQQVLEAGHLFPATETADLLQTFRVPVTTEVSWAELGLRAVTFTAGGPPFEVSLMAPGVCTCTALGDGFPMVTSSVITPTSSPFPHPLTLSAALRPTGMFPTGVTLTPGVDYWIHATPTADYEVAHSEASSYTEGRLYRSPVAGTPLAEESDRDLAFRLIGVERPLMAGPVTWTCSTCPPVDAFTGVTTTADFGNGSFPRSFAQVVRGPTGTSVPIGVKLPLGADAQSVTVTVRITPTDGFAGGLQVPSSSGYPLTNVTITASGGDMHWSEATFDRPIVMREHDPVSPTADFALVVESPPGSAPGRAKVALGEPGPCTCTSDPTLEMRPGFPGWQPIPGLSLGRVVLPSTRTADEDLVVMSSAREVGGATLTADIVQVFRVPVATRVEWVELAVPEGQDPAPPFTLSIVDPQGLPVPPPGELRTVTITAQFPPRASMALGSTWAPTDPFGQPTVLQPGRDYWLQARLQGPWRLASSASPVSGTSEVGRLYTRPPGDGDWTEAAGTLAFRVIGTANATTGASPGLQPRGLTLSADPLPFTRELSLRWSGGAGQMSVEIFDAGGRRVRHVRDAGPATQGAWTWRGEDDAGRAVRAGVYFARVKPASGPALNRRVVYLH